MNSGRCLQAKVAACAGAAGFLEAGEGVKGPGPATAPTCAGTNTTNLATTCMFVRRTCQVLVVVYHTTKLADVITCWYLRCFRCIRLIPGWCVFTHFPVYEQRLCIGARELLIEACYPRMAQGSRLHVGSREVHQGLS